MIGLITIVSVATLVVSSEINVQVCGSFGNTIGGGAQVKECNAACGSVAAVGDCNTTAYSSFPGAGLDFAPSAQARWGSPPPSNPLDQAGFGFLDLNSNQTLGVETNGPLFHCGTMVHFNFGVLSSTAASGVKLTMELNINGTIVEITPEFDIEETQNQFPCDFPSQKPCADGITIKDAGLFVNSTALIGDKTWALQVLGVVERGKPLSDYNLRWVSQEGTSSIRNLVCRFIDPCPASCPDGKPGRPVFVKDGSKVCGCMDEVVQTTTGATVVFGTPAPTPSPSSCAMIAEATLDKCLAGQCCQCTCKHVVSGQFETNEFCANANTPSDCESKSLAAGTLDSCTVDCGTSAPTPAPTPVTTMAGTGGGAGTTGADPNGTGPEQTQAPGPASTPAHRVVIAQVLIAMAIALMI